MILDAISFEECGRRCQLKNGENTIFGHVKGENEIKKNIWVLFHDENYFFKLNRTSGTIFKFNIWLPQS